MISSQYRIQVKVIEWPFNLNLFGKISLCNYSEIVITNTISNSTLKYQCKFFIQKCIDLNREWVALVTGSLVSGLHQTAAKLKAK